MSGKQPAQRFHLSSPYFSKYPLFQHDRALCPGSITLARILLYNQDKQTRIVLR